MDAHRSRLQTPRPYVPSAPLPLMHLQPLSDYLPSSHRSSSSEAQPASATPPSRSPLSQATASSSLGPRGRARTSVRSEQPRRSTTTTRTSSARSRLRRRMARESSLRMILRATDQPTSMRSVSPEKVEPVHLLVAVLISFLSGCRRLGCSRWRAGDHDASDLGREQVTSI